LSDSVTELSRLTGAQILVEYLVRQQVPFAAGIPGHGCWAITDALLDRRDAIRTIQVMHEQSAVHLADGYFRATGRPMLAFTSIGPGAMNAVVGMGTAYVDSTAVALAIGSPHTYMRGHGLFQEFERRHHADNPRVFEPVVKEWCSRRASTTCPSFSSGRGTRCCPVVPDPSCSTSRWTSRRSRRRS
jgi:acetolactate synthase-1/2/3 large subunit